jgi:hypothetical protein
MSRTIRTTAALGLALLTVAAPAAAQSTPPAHVPVPAGQLQHTVTDTVSPATTNTFRLHSRQLERWMTADAGRELTTDLTTGKVIEDCQYTLTVNRCWVPSVDVLPGHPAVSTPQGAIYVMPGNENVLVSWADAGADVKSLVGDPRGYSLTGTTTYLGHPALILNQATGKDADGGTSSATVFAEADNYYPLHIEDVSDNPSTANNGPHGPKIIAHFDSITDTKTLETISPNGVQLTIDAHPGAKVIDERPAAVAAAKKAAARKKAAAHKKAAARHKTVRKHKGYGK